MTSEASALRVSLTASLLFAAAGTAVAYVSDSRAILFDSVYSLVSGLTAWAALWIAARLDRPGNRLFPFGYAAFEPFLVFVNGILILGAAVGAMILSAASLLSGGHQIGIPAASAYVLAAAVLCLGCAAYLQKSFRRNRSALVLSERTAWLIDGVLSLGVFVAFAVAYFLRRSRYASWIPYFDPLITLVLVALVLGEPIRLVRLGLRELLLVAPPPETVETLERDIRAAAIALGAERVTLRILRLGRTLFIAMECAFCVGPPLPDISVSDRIRDEALRVSRASAPLVRVQVTCTVR